jgi:hypothetical protein
MADKKIADSGDALIRYNKDMGDGTWAQRVIAMLLDATGAAFGTAANPLNTSTAPLSTSDLSIATAVSTAVGDTSLVPAASGVATRVYRVRFNVAGANTLVIKNGTTVLETITFAGPGFLTYDFSTRPWYKTSTNTALILTTSTTAQVNMVVEFTQGA